MLRSLGIAVAALMLFASSAAAKTITKTFKYGPINVAGYEVKQTEVDFDAPEPEMDGFVTRMETDVVDKKGRPVPIDRLMLHHIVFHNFGPTVGAKRDNTCSRFTMLNSTTVIPAVSERFYGAGEERQKLVLPPGYGYKTSKKDDWMATWMLMNHRKQNDSAYIQYKVTITDDPATVPVTPYWMDVENCFTDPQYSIPGGGAPGSQDVKTMNWTAPKDMRIIAAGGHVHGGAADVTLRQPQCENRTLFTSIPAWGTAKHPFYTVKPVLHEPGPIFMTRTLTQSGYPVAKGEQIQLRSTYDGELPHTRAMGIVVMYAADASAAPPQPCSPLPTDVVTERTSEPHRTSAPRFTVPLTGINKDGHAIKISAPPGKRIKAADGAMVRIKDFAFSRKNLSLPVGAKLSWRFDDFQLHDVTLASGPRGFASTHLNNRKTFTQEFDTPGTYKIFCSLHPVRMTQTVKVG
ncbi:MAG: hypothetical protein JHC95_13925 [Solirubrobacteraceae bacterium]|nr:hypothetical protein [Solirubrobacteraceae bacterium]